MHESFSKQQVECLSSLNTEIVRSDISHESEETSYNKLNKIQAAYNSNMNTHINSSEEHTHFVEDGAPPLLFPKEDLKAEDPHFLGDRILQGLSFSSEVQSKDISGFPLSSLDPQKDC